MLVLSRRIGEAIAIDGGIEVTVVAVKGDKVRLGFTAPDDVTVNRKEVADKIAANQTTGDANACPDPT